MSKIQVQRGDSLDLTAPAGGVTSGVPVLIGGLLVVPQVSAAVGEQFSGAATGVHSIAKEDTTAAFNEGEIVYWDDSNARLDAVSYTHLTLPTTLTV